MDGEKRADLRQIKICTFSYFCFFPYWCRGVGEGEEEEGGAQTSHLHSDSSIYKALSAHIGIQCPPPITSWIPAQAHLRRLLLYLENLCTFFCPLPSITDNHDHTSTITTIIILKRYHLLSNNYG